MHEEQGSYSEGIDLKGIIKRNKVTFLILFVGIFLAGLFYSFTVTPYYQTRMIISSNVENSRIIEFMINNIDNLKKDGNVQSLAGLLKIDENAVAQLRSIRISDEFGEMSDDLYSAEIELTVFSNEVVNDLSTKLVEYLKNNEYLKTREDARRNAIEEFIKSSKEDLDLLNESGSLINGKDDKYIREIIMIQSEKLKYLNAVELVQKPFIPNTPSGPSKMLILFISFGLALVVATVVVYIKELM